VLKRDNASIYDKLSDQTASNWTRRLFQASKIHGTKVGHAGRVKGAQIAELRGVSEDQVSIAFFNSILMLLDS
jgi:hypothetical protein